MPRSKSWKKGKMKRRNVNDTKKVSDGGKYDLFLTYELTEDLTEELASLKTENSDTLRDVTEELASLKTENKDIVQGSVNLVTLKKVESNLPVNYLYNSQSQKGKDEVLVSHRNQSTESLSTESLSKISGKVICQKIIYFKRQNKLSVNRRKWSSAESMKRHLCIFGTFHKNDSRVYDRNTCIMLLKYLNRMMEAAFQLWKSILAFKSCR